MEWLGGVVVGEGLRGKSRRRLRMRSRLGNELEGHEDGPLNLSVGLVISFPFPSFVLPFFRCRFQ